MLEHELLVISAILLDAVLGDPDYRWHPIRVLGRWSLWWEQVLFAGGARGYLGGISHGLLVTVGALGAWWGGRCVGAAVHPAVAAGWDIFIASSLLCTRALIEHGQRVLAALDEMPVARAWLSHLVSRDTAALDRAGIVRATIESLAENLTDAVLTPLWALALCGLPGLIVVKAISTLDSLVGYRTPRYLRFGWAAARADDVIHWLPARLSVPLIAVAAWWLGLDARAALRTAWRDHGLLESPNSGWSEAACAGALRVRLHGPAWYGGQLVTRPFIGDADWPAALEAAHLNSALRLLITSAGLASVSALALAWCCSLA